MKKPKKAWDWSGVVHCHWSMSAGHSAPTYWWDPREGHYALPTPNPVEMFGLVPANRGGREGAKFRVRVHVDVELLERGKIKRNPWYRPVPKRRKARKAKR